MERVCGQKKAVAIAQRSGPELIMTTNAESDVNDHLTRTVSRSRVDLPAGLVRVGVGATQSTAAATQSTAGIWSGFLSISWSHGVFECSSPGPALGSLLISFNISTLRINKLKNPEIKPLWAGGSVRKKIYRGIAP